VTEQDQPRIVVGVDGSAGSRDALRWAVELASAFGARIDAVAAWSLPMTSLLRALPASFSLQPEIEELLTTTVDDVFGSDRPPGMRQKVLEGPAAEVLVAASKGALMLVVGSRGKGGFTGLLPGSESARVA
jgi:nucleotide-binding universal stress UspA family protein